MILLQLFLSFLQIGAFSIGGGYAAMPLIQNQVVSIHQWLNIHEFTDLVTIAEMTPGPIAINAATFVGIRVAGIPGALTATFACVLPPCLIVSLLAYLYHRYRKMSVLQHVLSCLRPAVVALIAAAGCSILQLVMFNGGEMLFQNVDWMATVLFALALITLRIKKKNPILIMALCGAVYMVLGLIFNL